MILLKQGNIEISSPRRLIRRDEAQAIIQAAELLQNASQEADAIRQQAQDEFAKQQQLGFQQGLDEGKTEISLQKLGLVEKSVEYLGQMENRVVDIVLAALRKCVAEINDRDLMVQIILNAMRAIVRNQQQVTLKVSHEMVPVVRERLQDIISRFPSVNYIDVIEAPNLTNRACILETDAGNVDASLDAQLDAIEKALKRCFKK